MVIVTDIEHKIRAQIKLIEKNLTHLLIKMLTCMNEFHFESRKILSNLSESCNFNKVGTGTNNDEDLFQGIYKINSGKIKTIRV